MNEALWLVWSMDRATAHSRHSTQASAIAEATRIAQKDKKPVHVLMSIGQAVPLDPPVEWRTHEDWKPVDDSAGGFYGGREGHKACFDIEKSAKQLDTEGRGG